MAMGHLNRLIPLASAAATAAAALALAAPASAGGPISVDVTDDEFINSVVALDVSTGGGTWQWDSNNQNAHNVRQDKGLFNSGPAVPVAADYSIDPSAGTFPYYCTVHGGPRGLGMSGKLRVRPLLLMVPARGDVSVSVLWSTGANETGNQFDVQFKVNDGKWKDWRKNTSKPGADFGANDKPVNVNPSKTYRIRARSEKKSNPKQRSGWSPPAVIEFT
jgi:plastocyanin